MTDFSDNESPTKRIAAIDLGTNSFHAVIVDIYPDGSFRTIDKLKEMVILAEKGMDNYLSEDAMQRGLDALKRIKFLCDSQQVEEILAYATSAIREARNGGDFIQRMIDEVDIKARAISGKMEAEMIGLAVRHNIALSEEMVLMVDIGGGSVEFIIGNVDEFIYYNSLKLGVARMAAKFVSHDPITKKEIKNLKDHYQKTLGEVEKIVKEHSVKTMIGSSGTMENIAAMIASRNSINASITLNELVFHDDEFIPFYEKFIRLDKKERLKEKQLEDKRVDIINPGMVLLKFLIEELNIQNIKISEAALRDGMIIDFINKEKPKLSLVANFPDPRKRSIYELLRKTNWMEQHSTHVANMGLQIFDEFQADLKLTENDRELLNYASLLHDIGYYISFRKHHKHALYLIRNSDLRGFTDDEINIMANVARYHRRSTPKKRHPFYKQLDKPLRKRIKKLSAILRIADGLDRSHYQNVKSLEIENGKEKVKLLITTEGDPELEIWGAERKSELFKKVTGKELEIFAVTHEQKLKATKNK
ncbi:Ppx/GppA family phosphatase [Christiangramia fulva]|uniref:Ppx/GppA family phosphatase n=1 Tax=Christiangramia fulva TaxID=2126553 RepID=A0A2R3Z2R4_9FLAO|nr:Ppx/GppA phosphatase family protein [Christiangramia fulva]AVR44570.1 Ppx/GppA family phosphatase [Christiangramia fulva]